MVPPDSRSKAVELQAAGGDDRTEIDHTNTKTKTSVHYLEAGHRDSDPLVLLHGIGLDAAGISWKHVIPALAGRYRVIAPDLPGHGKSDKPDIQYTTEYYIDVLEKLIDTLALDSVRLGGISMGGAIALGYALQNDVERLALVDSYGLGIDAPWRPMVSTALRIPGVDQLLWQMMGVSKGTVRDTLRGYMTQTSPELVTEVHGVLQDPDCGRTLRRWQRSEFGVYGFKTCYLDELDELLMPTLLIHGADDTLLPSTWSRRADDRLPDSELHVLENCGHWPPRERPERFNTVLANFLAS